MEVDVDYRRDASSKMDSNYNGWDCHRGPGPVQNALMRYDTVEGLAVGAFGEASPHVLAGPDL